MLGRKFSIMLTAILLGFFITTQSRSFDSLNELIMRDSQSNIFQEIMILKEKNEDLGDEIDELSSTLEQLADQNLALFAIQEEISKYQKLIGDYPLFGPGIEITMNGEITAPWIIDLMNELLSTGAQAVSVNGIRITNSTAGFDVLPQGQILLNGTILSEPYVFGAIGKSSTIIDVLELPGGIFDRFEASFPGMKIETEMKEFIQMS